MPRRIPKTETERFLYEKKTWLDRCQKEIGLSFGRSELLAAALAHPSYRHEAPKIDLDDFERLEFFGDAILTFVISEILYERFPEANEGLLSQLRGTLVSKKGLARTAIRIGLVPCLLLGRSEEKRPQRDKLKIYADALEAVIAAVFFDRGLAKVRQFISNLFENYLDLRYLKRVGISPKNLLQEWVQKKFKTLPQYHCEIKDGHFLVWASVPRKGKAKAEARSKKEAEEKAARLLLTILKKKSLRARR